MRREFCLAGQLADKPSQLIRDALQDLQAVSECPEYEVFMPAWHRPSLHGPCLVCLAGSVIAARLMREPDLFCSPDFFDASIAVKLEALDQFRQGFVSEALKQLNINPFLLGCDFIPVTAYEKNSAKFVDDLNAIANRLEAKGY